MAMPPGGPMEVVFSFDTTGSMSKVLDEVKARVNDIVQRLQADIPGFKVGIIAHGDYCDVNEFYDIKTLDLTDNVADVVTFVNETDGTGGGDVPECYELALRHANTMAWSAGSRRVLVVIGDAYPHDPDYDLNTQKIDWKDELNALIKKGVRVYGVQVRDDPESTSFFLKLTNDSGGQHLKLANMNTICQVIMGICYREHGAELFENYEAELRADKQRNFGQDLEGVFGALRKESSRVSDAGDIVTATPPSPESDTSDPSTSSSDGASSSAIPNIPSNAQAKAKRSESKKDLDVSIAQTSDGLHGSRKRKMPDRLQMNEKLREAKRSRKRKMDGVMTCKEKVKGTKTGKQKSKVKAKGILKGKVQKKTVKNPPQLSRARRENVPNAKFRYSRLPWSNWHLAAAPAKADLPGVWKTVAQRDPNWLWRQDLLNLCITKIDKLRDVTTVFELGVKPRGSPGIISVYLHSTKASSRSASGVFGAPWYSGMFRKIRQLLTQVVKLQCKVYMRWAVVDSVTKKNILKDYDYPWCTGRMFYTRDHCIKGDHSIMGY